MLSRQVGAGLFTVEGTENTENSEKERKKGKKISSYLFISFPLRALDVLFGK
jgi:hypothetical protein